MFYLILATDNADVTNARQTHRQVHIDYWLQYDDDVKIAGPWLTHDEADAPPLGSMLIVEAPSLEAARSLAQNDPFVTEGVFSSDIRVEPIRVTLGDWKP